MRPGCSRSRLSLQEVLSKLRADMAARGKPLADDLPPYELAMRLLREYVRYPPPPRAWIPYNFCALGGVAPWTKPVLQAFCAHV